MRSKIPPSINCNSYSRQFLYNTLYNILNILPIRKHEVRQSLNLLTVCQTSRRKYVLFLFQHFFHNLRKQFSPKPWKIKVSTIVKHFYGMLIKNWQGENSWGQILKHLFSLKSHWIQCECYFIEDFNTRSFTWIRTLAFWLLIILWLACI